jgi:hypothetical protein
MNIVQLLSSPFWNLYLYIYPQIDYNQEGLRYAMGEGAGLWSLSSTNCA